MIGIILNGVSGIFGLLRRPKILMFVLVGAAVAFVVWRVIMFVEHSIETEKRLLRTQAELSQAREAIATQRSIIEQINAANEAAEKARLEAERRAAELSKIRDSILHSGDSEDGQIAPVLADTLRAIRSSK